MSDNSFIRKIDDLGRLVVPRDIRRKLNLTENNPLEVSVSDDSIIIKKYDRTTTAREVIHNAFLLINDDQFLSPTDKEFVLSKLSDALRYLRKIDEDDKGRR